MNFKEIKDELKTILQGKSQVSHGELIQTISLYLRRSKETGALVEAKQYSKKEETEKLIQFKILKNFCKTTVLSAPKTMIITILI